MDPLASPDDLDIYLGVAVENEAQAELALLFASGVIRAETGQTLSLIEDDSVTLRGSAHHELELPERPIVSVSDVEADGVLDGEWVPVNGLLLRVGGWPSTVSVTYTHGYATVPDDVRAIACAVAARVLAQYRSGGPEITQETVGSYSVQYAKSAPASSSSALLTDGERSHLRRTYRRSVGTVLVR